jgi:hypothetical protein
MQVLIIGNGFDIVHGLETKYSDFLKYCERVPIKDLPQDNTLRQSLENNFWLSHFLMHSTDMGNTWIDFEDEILSAIVDLSRLINAKKPKFPRFFAFRNNNESLTTYTFIHQKTSGMTSYGIRPGYLNSVIDHSFELFDNDRTNWKQLLNDLKNETKEYCIFPYDAYDDMMAVLFKNKKVWRIMFTMNCEDLLRRLNTISTQ